MENWKLESWTDYWKLFDELCLTLTEKNKQQIVAGLKDAQEYVNGLTDGWYEFLAHFKATIDSNGKMLDHEEKRLADFLIKSLRQSLR